MENQFRLDFLITQCHFSPAGATCSVPSEFGRVEDGVGSWTMEAATLCRLSVMSAISVLEVQFDNSVQFLSESKFFLPPAFKFGG